MGKGTRLQNARTQKETQAEITKRRREALIVAFVSGLFVLLTWFEFRLTHFSQNLPFVHSIFFFGLVNFNIALVLFLLFLIFRNVVKIFVERQGRFIGASLKSKLVASFATFSIVPTTLIFLISVFYINSSFDKWFGVKMARVLKDSLEVTNTYVVNAKRENYHFAHLIADEVARSREPVERVLRRLRGEYRLDAVEYYSSPLERASVLVGDSEGLEDLPRASLEFLQKGLVQRNESSTIHHLGQGNLIRVIVPVESKRRPGGSAGAIVVSTFVPLSLLSKMDDIASAYDQFRDISPLQYPLKSIYLIILVLMTLVILFAAIWFGFHLARQLSTPLERLATAARDVARGQFAQVDLPSGSSEISLLVSSFNTMTRDLEHSQGEVKLANQSLQKTLDRLDEHSRYVEVVLSNVTTGVISMNPLGVVTTVNRYAVKLLKLGRNSLVGEKLDQVLPEEYKAQFTSLQEALKSLKVDSIQKEVRVQIGGESLLLQMTLAVLRDEGRQELGMVLVFDDMTPLVNAQRAAAWREVARRIAHEIKNPLTPIKLSAQRLQKKFAKQITDSAFETCTTTIIKQVDELRDLVNEFSNFARLPQSRPVRGSFNSVVDEALVLYRTGHRDMAFEQSYDPKLPPFEFDPEQIKRVIGNLLQNSISAIDPTEGVSGDEVVSDNKSLLPKGLIQVSTEFDTELGIVKLIVRDNGPGIPAELRERIFEPYFSTKKTGTGLGLAIVKRIVDDHNGFVRAYANEPRGTRIVIELPVVHPLKVRKASDAGRGAEAAGVEDSASILDPGHALRKEEA